MERLAGADGVRQVVAARVADDVAVLTDVTTAYARLVVVDAAAYRRLLAATPLPDAPQLNRLRAGASGAGVPALVRAGDPALRSATRLSIRSGDTTIRLTAVGPAPAVGSGEGDVVIVDATAFAAAGGSVSPNTVWVNGSGAERAVAASAAGGGGSAVLRSRVLRSRRTAPLPAGLAHLAGAGAGVLVLLGLLTVVLSAATTAPARRETLARLRTMGLRPAEARRLTAGELAPPVVFAVAGGAAAGLLLAYVSLRLLDLRLLTGQAGDPALVVPWFTLAVAAVLLLAALVAVVRVESALGGRAELGQVLRAGG